MSTLGDGVPAALSPVIVLGMHRSGTSYLASVVGAVGVHIGDQLLAAAPDNPRGYFEDRDFVAFQSKVLSRALPPQGSPSPLGNILVRDIDSLALTEGERAEAMRLVAPRRDSAIWGWKDPRTCLLLDFWLELFPAATLVGVYRHPLDVYCSLVKRQQLQVLADESLLIDTWTAYNSAILRAWRKHRGRKVLVGAGDLFGRPADLARLLAATLGLPAPSGPFPEFVAEEFRRLPVDSAVHGAFSTLFPAADRVFAELQERSALPLEYAPGDREFWDGLVGRVPEEGRAAALLPVMAHLLAPEIGRQRDALLRQAAFLAVDRGSTYDELATKLATARTQAAKLAGELVELSAQSLAAEVDHQPAGGLYLWADNPIGRRVRDLLERRGIVVTGMIDRAEGGALSPQEFFRRCAAPDGRPRPFVLVCTVSARTEICGRLREAGFCAGRDFAALPRLQPETLHET